MSGSRCTPVVVDGWGGAGDGCVAVGTAGQVLGEIEDAVRAAFPEDWQSTAADEFRARLTDLLGLADGLRGLLETAQERAAALSAAVAVAWGEQ
ncbi:hypothetical protein FE251_14990 [Georgenia wutianyii]|uniref:WXG100 family type VII secretion target n=1 Tax=Georgenia wutianyii TaxID=2585135 RepID=A0ABX5VU08_9MICO|nr:hypothetical protein [Georgenia wutianyii]QDB80530.1 hypothetical protein FE251_14990 [Georgenia wutianyii]